MQNTRWVGKSNSPYFSKGTDIWSKVKRIYHLFLPWIVLRLNEAFFRKKKQKYIGYCQLLQYKFLHVVAALTEAEIPICLFFKPHQYVFSIHEKCNSLYFSKGTDIRLKVKRIYRLYLPWVVLRLIKAFFLAKNTGILGTANFCSTDSF